MQFVEHETDNSIYSVYCMCFGLHFGYIQYCTVLDSVLFDPERQ